MAELILYFLTGFTLCFVGTLPFGPINLSVVKVTVDHGKSTGAKIALAASFIEIIQAAIAVLFGLLIIEFVEENLIFKLVLALVFVSLAFYIVSRKPAKKLSTEIASPSEKDHVSSQQQSWFIRGLLIAALNPQAIPYWIFALAAAAQYLPAEFLSINLNGSKLLVFLASVFAGKFAALYGFVVISDYLSQHLQQCGLWVNRLLATVLLLIGISQAWSGLALYLAR